MDPKITNFLSKHRISVITTLLPDGIPHSASCHYAHTDDPFSLIILTENTTRKCQGLLDGNAHSASMVIGFSEEEWVELQMSGQAKIVSVGEEYDKAKIAFETKFKTTLKLDPEDVFIIFTPTWWRYTEFKTNPKVLVTS